MDNKSFFGGVLHICYAPEFETVDDTREKLQERQRVVAKKIRGKNKFKTKVGLYLHIPIHFFLIFLDIGYTLSQAKNATAH